MNALVAIIEDDAAIANMYAAKLKLDGYEVEIADDGEKGLAMILRSQPQVILLDIMLPGLNGVELMTRLSQYPEASKSHIIVLTNLDKPITGEEVRRLGAAEYVVKAATTPQQVSDKIAALLKPSSPAEPPQSSTTSVPPTT